MKKSINVKYKQIGLMVLLAFTVIILPYMVLPWLSGWVPRLIAGLWLETVALLFILYAVFSPKIVLHGHALKGRENLAGRIIFFTLGVVGLPSMISYDRAVLRLALNNGQPERIIGVVEYTSAIFPGSIMYRDIHLQNFSKKLTLIYPFGKRLHHGSRYEFIILPGVNYVLDIKPAPPETANPPISGATAHPTLTILPTDEKPLFN